MTTSLIPITQREFYQLYAFFNNVPEKGLDGNQGNAAPVMQFPTPEQAARQRVLEAQIASLQKIQQDQAADETLKKEAASELQKREQERGQLAREIPSTMVMDEMKEPRETFVLVRGQYDQFGTKVEAKTPDSLSPFPHDAPRNRLGLAQWLVAPEQPLTSRVIANRYWQMLFGTGLVATAEDFGSQGEQPTHPELLDWLACEFQHSTQPPVAGTSSGAMERQGLDQVTGDLLDVSAAVPCDAGRAETAIRRIAGSRVHRDSDCRPS